MSSMIFLSWMLNVVDAECGKVEPAAPPPTSVVLVLWVLLHLFLLLWLVVNVEEFNLLPVLLSRIVVLVFRVLLVLLCVFLLPHNLNYYIYWSWETQLRVMSLFQEV